MILPDPQLGLDLRAVPEARPPVDPRTLRRVDRMTPAAPDGEAWNAAVEALAERMAADGPLYPSALHVAAEAFGEPPQGPGAWGSLFARLRARGWTKVYAPRTSRVEARNGAEEPFAWVKPEGVSRA